MSLQFDPLFILYIMAAATTVGLAIYTWRMRPARGAALWAGAMTCCAIWCASTLVEYTSTTMPWKLVGLRGVYLGVTGTIYFWSLFIIAYSHLDRWLTRRNAALLAIGPGLAYLLLLTTEWHHLFHKSYELQVERDFIHLEAEYGPAFWAWAAYGYVAIFGGALVLIQAVVRYPSLYRGQAAMLALGAIIPTLSNAAFISGANPIHPYDPTSVAFTVSGILITLGVRRYRFLDVVPVAYDLVFKNVNSGVIIIDLQGRIMDMNPQAEKIVGHKRDEVLGKVTFDALPEFTELLQQFAQVMEINTEITVDQHIYELQIMPLTDRSGNVGGRIIMLFDITVRKQALAERDKLITELDAYAHTVAHDLKNPIGLVVSYIDMMDMLEVNIPDNMKKPLAAITRSAKKMTTIIDSLLLLSRVRDATGIETTPLDMGPLVAGALGRLANVIEGSGAEIRQPETWPVAEGYAPWIEEIWANFVSNAIKYGGEPPLVELGSTQLDGAVRFWIKDNGRGMTEEERTSLFAQFSRLEHHAKIEGHGLGLSIVQRIAERLGGTAGVDSTIGQGSTFYFTLPVPAATAENATDPEALRIS